MELRLHADDLKKMEDVLARALARALMTSMRMIVKEGLLERLIPVPAQHVTPAQPVPPVQAAPPAPVQTAPPPVEQVATPEPEPTRPTVAPQIVEVPKPREQAKRTRRSIREVCKTVATRPPGYVTLHDATKLIDGLAQDAAYHQIAKWALDREVRAVIVADHKYTPTKGLPGRLMVENDSVKARERMRQQNAKMPAKLRQSAPKLEVAA